MKKRGKASQKDTAERATAAPASTRDQGLSAFSQASSAMGPALGGTIPGWTDQHEATMLLEDMSAQHTRPRLLLHSHTEPMNPATGLVPANASHDGSRAHSLGTGPGLDQLGPLQQIPNLQGISHQGRALRGSPSSVSMHGYPLTLEQGGPSAGSSPLEGSPLSANNPLLAQVPRSHSVRSSMSNYSDVGGRFLSTQDPLQTSYSGRPGETPMLHSSTNSPIAGSSDWLSPHSPSSSSVGNFQAFNAQNPLRYPVLEPALLWLTNTVPVSLACDLLEHYFTGLSFATTNSILMEFHSCVFRKQSILHKSRPRKCSPGLLISMLCVAAHTSPSPFLGTPEARGRVCHALFNRATACNQNAGRGTHIGGRSAQNEGYKAQGTLTADLIHSRQRHAAGFGGPPISALDDVATYYHLALFSSYTEYGPESLRWWDAAISLAKELRLGQELPPNTRTPSPRSQPGPSARKPRSNSDISISSSKAVQWAGRESTQEAITEEDREERRRMWWLLYIADRFLSLTLNRSAILVDADCQGLLQPVDEHIWQFGDEYLNPEIMADDRSAQHFRPRGPSYLINSLGFYGLLSPLMTILGGIVALRQALGHQPLAEWNRQAGVVQSQLDGFQQSLSTHELHSTEMEYRLSMSNPSTNLFAQSGQGNFMQSRIAIAYGYFLVHVLHLLLHGHWDPVLLLEDTEVWRSSPFFASATEHAVEAAHALDRIFECDHELSLMPEYLGAFGLQGSFFFLYYSEKLSHQANERITSACQTFFRAMSSQRFKMKAEYQVRYGCSCSMLTATLMTANSSSTAVSCTRHIQGSAPKAPRAKEACADAQRWHFYRYIDGPMGARV